MSGSVSKVNKVSAPVVPVTVIRPPKGWTPINLRELWTYREYQTSRRVSYKGDGARINNYSQREMAKRFAEVLDTVTR